MPTVFMAKVNRRGQALVLSPEQLKEIFRFLPDPHNQIAQIAFHTSSRISEVLALRRRQLSPDGITIIQTKTGATKLVPWTKELREIAGTLSDRKDYLFESASKSGHMSTQAFEKQLNKVLADLDIVGASTHSFRRSMATLLYRAGVDLESIRQRTGHSSLESLTLYIDISRDEAAAKVEKALDKFWRIA
jgi:integrase/recombinase XerD